MEIDLLELKSQARASIAQADPGFRTVALVYILMTTGVSFLLSLLPLPVDPEIGMSFAGLFLSILYNLYAVVVGFGFTLWGLWITRRLNPGLSSLTQGFSVSGRVIWMKMMILLRLMCFGMLLTFGMSFLVVLLVPTTLSHTPLLTLLLLYSLLFAALWGFSLRYALAPYLLADHPDDGPLAPIRRSVVLMRGWKGELFRLELSFLGWHLLTLALTLPVWGAALWYFGIFDMGLPATVEEVSTLAVYCASAIQHPLTTLASTVVTLPVLLWLLPYLEAARAGFYDARLQVPQYPERPMMPPV